MSLENNIKRIADALELIASSLEKKANPLMTIAETCVIKQEGIVPPVVGKIAPASALEVEPVDTTGIPSNPTELRELAQEIATKLDPNEVLKFTAWVRDTLCGGIGVKKIVEIPADEVNKAARMLLQFARERKINV
jgi:hypothetical protein